MSAENSGKPLVGRVSEAHSATQTTYLMWTGLAAQCPPPRSRPSASIFGLSVFLPVKNPGHALIV